MTWVRWPRIQKKRFANKVSQLHFLQRQWRMLELSTGSKPLYSLASRACGGLTRHTLSSWLRGKWTISRITQVSVKIPLECLMQGRITREVIIAINRICVNPYFGRKFLSLCCTFILTFPHGIWIYLLMIKEDTEVFMKALGRLNWQEKPLKNNCTRF